MQTITGVSIPLGKADLRITDVSTGQWWGKIGVFLYYDRKLTEAETTQNYNAFASRFGLESRQLIILHLRNFFIKNLKLIIVLFQSHLPRPSITLVMEAEI